LKPQKDKRQKLKVRMVKQKKSKVKVTLCQHTPRLPALPSLITFQFQSLVVLLSDIMQKRVLCCIYYFVYIWRLIVEV